MEANEARIKRESRTRERAQKSNFFPGVRLAFRARLALAGYYFLYPRDYYVSFSGDEVKC